MQPGPSASAPSPRERGYALVAAVAGIALLSALALVVIGHTRMALVRTGGLASQARAEAAVDAGFAIAIHALVDGDERSAALLDGRPMEADFHAAHITIHVVDERGKVPINRLDEGMVTRLLEQQGLGGHDLAVARDSLLDWLDDDDEPRPDGAEAPFYESQRILPRNGPLWNVDELARIRGIGPALAARLAPFVTVDPDVLSFDAAHGDPRALAALDVEGGAVTTLIRQREVDGARTALGFSDRAALIGRPLTVIVDASDNGARAHHEAVVEVLGNAVHPWRMRAIR